MNDPDKTGDEPRLELSPTGPLREVVAAWLYDLTTASAVIDRAAELLAATDTGATLLPLAVLPADVRRADLEAALREVFTEAGDAASLQPPRVQELTLVWLCRRYLEGDTSGQRLVVWAHATSHHDGPPDFEPFEWLADALDDGMNASTFELELHAAIQALLDSAALGPSG